MCDDRTYIARLALGYQISQVLFAALNLRLFTHLEEAAMDLETIAERSGADASSLERLLLVLRDLKLVEERDALYYNTEQASWHLVEGRKDYWGSTIHHAGNLWWCWEGLERHILSGRGKTPGPEYLEDYPHRLGDYLSAMDERARAKAAVIAEAIGIGKFRHMLDMGCGPGTYALAFADMNPNLLVTLLDLEPSLDLLRVRLRESRAGERITCRVCEVTADAIPGEGYDLVFVSHLIHLYADMEAELIVEKAWKALACPGELVIHDYLLDAGGEESLYASLFNLTMLVGTPRGKCYRVGEVMAMLRRLNASELRLAPLDLGTSLVVARKG